MEGKQSCCCFCFKKSGSSKSTEKAKPDSAADSSSSSPDIKMAGKNFLQPSFPAVNSQQRLSDQSNPRNKVALKPGRSLMDWIRLGRSGQDLTGVGGKILEVDVEELAKHNKKNDSWISLRGKVYNISPYMEYHPGGEEELMRGAGIDGTQLFDEVHKWVNYESMLEKCFVGKLKSTTPVHRRVSELRSPVSSAVPPFNSSTKLLPPANTDLPTKLQTSENSKNGPYVPVFIPPTGPLPPKFDWFQSSENVTLVVYTKWKYMKSDFVIIDKSDGTFLCSLYIEEYIYSLHIELEESVSLTYDVKVHNSSGKTEITLKKIKKDHQWKTIGKPLTKHNKYVKVKDQDIVYRSCTIDSVSEVTHNSKLLCVALPAGTRMCVPLGYHVHIKHSISGMEIVRSYTVVSPSLGDHDDSRIKEGQAIYLMIKIYPDGALTPWINTLNKGDSLEVSSFTGDFKEEGLPSLTDLVMFAAGTGFTPMVRLINYCILNSSIKMSLVFFNKTEKDILWYDQLKSITEEHERLHVEYILSEADDSWLGRKGRVTIDIMKDSLPLKEENSKILICACGPTPFTKTVIQFAKDLGYTDDQCHAFLG